MLNSVLLHLEQTTQAEAVIRWGVSVAFPFEARVRGLTLVDTRGLDSALTNEAALAAVVELTRHAGVKIQQGTLRAKLSQACLEAGLNFDVRRDSGDPLQVLAREARFHDLIITSVARDKSDQLEPGGLSPRDLFGLLDRGVQPLLVVQPKQSALDRVLLVYDGSVASGRAIRSFLSLGILPQAEHRLLAIGADEVQARAALREMADYCVAQRRSMQLGWIAGKTRRLLLPYAEQWQADLLVAGVNRGNRLWRWLAGDPALELWRKLPGGLYITT
jgi:nucleotide-binding universal stress UspA family protein